MDYIEFDFTITPAEPGREILVAMLSDVGFESFVETEKGLLAYVSSAKFSTDTVKNLEIMHNKEFLIKYTFNKTEDKNWNEEWERVISLW